MGDDHLVETLLDLHKSVGAPSASALLRRIDRLGLYVGRSTIFDLLRHKGRPEWSTVEPFVRACLDIAAASGARLSPDWDNLDWWQALQERRPSGQRRARRNVVRVGRVPPMADAFQHRDEEPLLDEAGTVVLSGLGGVGKTQLAAHHAGLAKADLLVWVDAATRTSILDQYRLAASTVGIDVHGMSGQQAAESFLVWLGSGNKRWLVVLDDLADPNDLHGLWPPATVSGQTLVTTRRADSVLAEQGRTILRVGVYTDTQAHQYLHDAVRESPRLADDIDGVARDLGNLPLALSHAAAFMKNKQVTCTDYRRRFAARRSLAEVLPTERDSRPDEYRLTVTATLSLAIEAANALEPAGIAEAVLEMASVLDGAGIPREVFSTDPALAWILESRDVDANTAADGLQCLRLLNLATIDADIVQVHTVVQAITRDRNSAGTAAARAAADALWTIWPDNDAATGAILRANAAAVQPHLDPGTPHRIAHRAIVSRAASGDPAGAIAAATELLAVFSRVLGPDDPDTLRSRISLAQWRGEAGDPASAVAGSEEVLHDLLRVLGADHPATLVARNNLAYWRGQAGDPAGAVAAFEELLADRLRLLGPDHPDTLDTRNNLADSLGVAGNPAGAVTVLEELLADRLRLSGPDHPDTLLTRNNLLSYRGDAGEAATSVHAAFEELVAAFERVLGPDHPHTLGTRQNRARWRGMADDPAGALAEFQNLLEDQLRILGPDHPDTLKSRGNLARWTGEAGDPAGAAAALQDQLEEELRVLGPNHPDTLTTRHDLARWRAEAGDPDGAVAALQELLEDRLRLLGSDHPATLATRNSLAVYTGAAGDPAAAVAALEALLDDVTRVLGSDQLETLTIRANVALWRRKAGDLAGAITALEKLLEDQLRVLGPDNPTILATRNNLARARAEGGDPTGAVAAFEELLADEL